MDLPSFMYLLYFALLVIAVGLLAVIARELRFRNRIEATKLLLASTNSDKREQGENRLVNIGRRTAE